MGWKWKEWKNWTNGNSSLTRNKDLAGRLHQRCRRRGPVRDDGDGVVWRFIRVVGIWSAWRHGVSVVEWYRRSVSGYGCNFEATKRRELKFCVLADQPARICPGVCRRLASSPSSRQVLASGGLASTAHPGDASAGCAAWFFWQTQPVSRRTHPPDNSPGELLPGQSAQASRAASTNAKSQ